MPINCRFFEQKFPDLEDVVMANVVQITDMGAYVHLLEYNNTQGMILLSELSRRRIRSINKLVRVGRTEPVVVIRVDKNKGYIDLSKRRVSPEDIAKCTDIYSKAKAVNSILRHVATILQYKSYEQLEDLYKKTAWMFEAKTKQRGSSHDWFKQIVVNPSILDECDLDARTKEVLLENIKQKLSEQPVKIRADVDVACYTYEGIEAVKRALKKGIECSTPSVVIKINLIAPPLYVITSLTPERQDGLRIIGEACKAIQVSIEETGGVFKIQMEPKVVTATEEDDLAKQLKKAEEENAEVSGDEDDDEVVGMGGTTSDPEDGGLSVESGVGGNTLRLNGNHDQREGKHFDDP